MKKRLLPIFALATIALASCGSTSDWSWADASADETLNYCLLIGQIDHNDSAARTAGIREALGTRGSNTGKATGGANSEVPEEGKLKLSDGVEYKTVEIEHAEQKTTAGVTWDSATATSTAETWINKHGNDIDFFVSNNDGMAEGAIGASNWIKGLPIFGYDSNNSTLQYIRDGKIMGTINQNASAQAAGIYMLTRNCIDGVTDPTKSGFSEESSNGYGKISSEYNFNETDKSMLVNNFAITADNVDQYVDVAVKDLVDSAVKKGTTDTVNVWQSYYSSSDTFLNTSMKPLFAEYAPLFNFNVTQTFGNGSDESLSTSNLESADASEYDAYIINMVKTTSTASYLETIATKVGATEANPTNVPVIFWNRQGTDNDGNVDTANMADKRFKNIYYVGFDAVQGGELQGQMIVDYLNAQASSK
ncbi:MAG: substrate-binding domain-containing protein [Bacilli bacterium]|nr:substrate-binding domain-containing protein [Bacilli bacterium]